MVVELGYGVTVYPARHAGDRWRAVWYEDGVRRQCESVTEDGLAGRLEKVMERLGADAPNLERPGSDLVAFYLSPDRLPAERQWSRKHAPTQARLCERFALPVIATVPCQDIKLGQMQQIVNAPATPGEGRQVHGMISALDAVVELRLVGRLLNWLWYSTRSRADRAQASRPAGYDRPQAWGQSWSR